MPSRILLIRLSAIGDVIHALHGLAALRASRRGAHLGFLVEDRAAALVSGHPDLDRVHVFQRKDWQSGLLSSPLAVVGSASRFLSEVRNERYDVVVDLQGNLKGGVLSRLSGAPRRIGLAAAFGKEGNHRFQTELVSLPEGPLHRVDRVFKLLGPLGVSGPAGTPRLAIRQEDRAEMDACLAAEGLTPGRFAVLHPATSAFGRHKRWMPERFAELARALHRDQGLPSVITWGPGEEDLAGRVAGMAGDAALKGPRTSRLTALCALIEPAGLFVGADTGATHLAALLGTPTVGLFGPKDPKIYGPRGERVEVVTADVECSPCTLRKCDDPICMKSIEASDVLAAAEGLLPTRSLAGDEG